MNVCDYSLRELCAPGMTLPVLNWRESFRNSVSQNLQRHASFLPLQFRLSSPAEHGGCPTPPAQAPSGNSRKHSFINFDGGSETLSSCLSAVGKLATAAWRRMPILSARFGGRAKRNPIKYATMRNVRARRSAIYRTMISGGGRVFLIEPN